MQDLDIGENYRKPTERGCAKWIRENAYGRACGDRWTASDFDDTNWRGLSAQRQSFPNIKGKLGVFFINFDLTAYD